MLKKLSLMIAIAIPLACGTKQPMVKTEAHIEPKTTLTHVNLKTDCADCHEAERPEPNEDNIVVLHGEGAACESCHTWPAFANLNSSVKTHNPYPKQCLGCHSVAKDAASHPAQGDCKACHRWPAWTPIVPGG